MPQVMPVSQHFCKGTLATLLLRTKGNNNCKLFQPIVTTAITRKVLLPWPQQRATAAVNKCITTTAFADLAATVYRIHERPVNSGNSRWTVVEKSPGSEVVKNKSSSNLKKREISSMETKEIVNANGNGGGGDAPDRKIATVKGLAARAPVRCLAVFDFDQTVVDYNTDTVVADLLSIDKIPEDLTSIIDKAGWTEYMAEIFRLLHQHKVSSVKIRDCIRTIPEVPGFVRLIKFLKQKLNFDVIIISDSNSVFIEEWLQAHGLADTFTAVYTNPAHFDEHGLLHVKPYHSQSDCKLSAANLCKGRVLEHFLVERDLRHNLRYERIVYVGDGNNDICPVLRLRVQDLACIRQGYPMNKTLMKKRDKMKVRAQMIVWKNGFDLWDKLESALKPKDEINN